MSECVYTYKDQNQNSQENKQMIIEQNLELLLMAQIIMLKLLYCNVYNAGKIRRKEEDDDQQQSHPPW